MCESAKYHQAKASEAVVTLGAGAELKPLVTRPEELCGASAVGERGGHPDDEHLANRLKELEPVCPILVTTSKLEHVPGQHILWLDARSHDLAGLDNDTLHIVDVRLLLFHMRNAGVLQLLLLERLEGDVVLPEEEVCIDCRCANGVDDDHGKCEYEHRRVHPGTALEGEIGPKV